MSSTVVQLKQLPTTPGCYLFKNKAGTILYIGKAKNLHNRVRSYFHGAHDSKTMQLATQVVGIDFIVTDNEVEALLLEARLIKQHQPKYNIELKGGVRYAYIRLTNEEFPRLESVRLFKRTDTVFGPFAVGFARKNLINIANSLFKLRVGKRKPVRVGSRHMIRCSVPPWKRIITSDEYAADVARAKLLLSGKRQELISTLESEMRQYSKNNQFELAKIRRDQSLALKQLAIEQKVDLQKAFDQDVINFVRLQSSVEMQLFNITRGVVSNRKQLTISLPNPNIDTASLLNNFLTQFYFTNDIPQEIIVPEKVTERSVVEQFLSKLSGRPVKIVVPIRGEKRKLLELVKKNVGATLKRGDSALFELQTRLGLPTLPRRIECFDVSNLGADSIVGSMVSFADGLPDKDNYRKFKIRWQIGQSDFDAMHEIIFRRYRRVKEDGLIKPDLILIDGGKPQLTAGRTALKALELQIPIAALAKKQEELFLPFKRYSIRIPRSSPALQLLQKIRDEAHRFAVTYHRLLRAKKFEKNRYIRYN